jgi:hypothetical protein
LLIRGLLIVQATFAVDAIAAPDVFAGADVEFPVAGSAFPGEEEGDPSVYDFNVVVGIELAEAVEDQLMSAGGVVVDEEVFPAIVLATILPAGVDAEPAMQRIRVGAGGG